MDFKQSWSQRSRWTVGHIQCMKYYTKDLAKGIKEHKSLMNFDGLLYILGIPMMLVTFLLLGVNLLIYLANGMTLIDLIANYGRYLVSTFILPIATAVLIMILDKRKIKPMVKGLLLYPIFMGSWLIINCKCLFKRDIKWEKIKHVRNISINDVEKEMI